MKPERDGHFELQPVLRSTLPDAAVFLQRWYSGQEGSPSKRLASEGVGSIERRLTWLLSDNPAATTECTFGYCLRDSLGVIRGLNLSFPVAFVSSDTRLLGLCSGTFFVEPSARSLGFYLFKRCLNIPGCSFYFASTCNTNSSELWRAVGASPIPNSDTEYILPIRLDVVIAAYVAYRTSSLGAARIARMCGRSVNPILRLLTRPSAKLSIERCHDWEKLSELSRRHRSPDHITSDRSPAVLEWRYGPKSPSYPCGVYLFRDKLGNEGWFSLGHLTRGNGQQFRSSVLLDAIWPRKQMSYRDLLQQILRVAVATADAISFRWQPGLDHSEISRCVFPRKLGAPRAFVRIPKGAPTFLPDSLDYDDSDYMAWAFSWREG
jgi:hypothetical protein